MNIKELTRAEEQVMQELWKQGKAFVKEIIEQMEDPKPAYNTVSTIIRILETKGFVGHESFGKSHRYFPKVSKDDYKDFAAGKLISGYFDNSAKKMLSFFIQENRLNIKETDELLRLLEKAKKK
ncbi:BlaI/MecI/CopY family transcriptional regulator [Olivibacter domesticus]|uniref:Predicted transcriptional regulator n=1 Tax=Olivibacter domesticus TaxID=407022 RepID=A0A1H7RXC4_OLID1|nr:BlaI/MecI/CopY family transcriptional regulator [Olivibacter domesticus]SEL64950.1 Predicted transcriptional regulator [Olivibacter domesticus]